MERRERSFPGLEARSLVHDPDNGVSEGVWVAETIPRRHSNFEQRRSPSESIASESTVKARPLRASYQEPKTSSWRLTQDTTALPPIPKLYNNGSGGSSTPNRRDVPNFSRNASFQRQSGGNGQAAQGQNLTENVVPPPVASQPGNTDLESAQRQNLLPGEPEREPQESPLPFASRSAADYLHKELLPARPADWLSLLYTVSHLIFFSIFGTLARLGVQWIAFYPGTPVVTPVIWANVGGSFLMGFLAEDRQMFRDEWEPRRRPLTEKKHEGEDPGAGEGVAAAERAKVKKTIPLYVGLATGFCGSFTSFSSFMRDVFLALSNDLPAPVNHPSTGTITTTATVSRNGGYSLAAILAIILATLALSLGSLIVGAHAALALNPITPRIPSRFTRRILDPAMVLLGFGCWLGALFLAIFPPDRSSSSSSGAETWRGVAVFPILFAPAGCLLRFYASNKLNALVPSFPLGTFAANMFGVAIEAMCYDIQHVGVGVNGMVGGGLVGCQVLQGVQDGFCGCLTTVSTWVAEIRGLRRKSAYAYALASLACGFALVVVIMGSVRWSVGWAAPVCDTGYVSKI